MTPDRQSEHHGRSRRFGEHALRWCYTGQLATPTCNDMMLREKSFKCNTPLRTIFCDICSAATRCKVLKAIQKCGVSANLCEKHALRIGVASWRCKLTSVTPPLAVALVQASLHATGRSGILPLGSERCRGTVSRKVTGTSLLYRCVDRINKHWK